MKSKKKMLLCLFLLVAQLSVTQKIADKLYEKGLAELQAGVFDKALKNFMHPVNKKNYRFYEPKSTL